MKTPLRSFLIPRNDDCTRYGLEPIPPNPEDIERQKTQSAFVLGVADYENPWSKQWWSITRQSVLVRDYPKESEALIEKAWQEQDAKDRAEVIAAANVPCPYCGFGQQQIEEDRVQYFGESYEHKRGYFVVTPRTYCVSIFCNQKMCDHPDYKFKPMDRGRYRLTW